MKSLWATLLLAFYIASAWGSNNYIFDINLNEIKKTVVLNLSKENSFSEFISLPHDDRNAIWRFRVFSPDIPSHLIGAYIVEGGVVIKLNYNDPSFCPIDFHSLLIDELILYFRNESTEMKIAILDGLVQNARLDLFEEMLEFFSDEDFKGIEDVFVVSLEKIFDSYPSLLPLDTILKVSASGKISESYIQILLAMHGDKGFNEMEILKHKIPSNNELKNLIIKLSKNFPSNEVLKYLLNL